VIGQLEASPEKNGGGDCKNTLEITCNSKVYEIIISECIDDIIVVDVEKKPGL